MKAIGYVRVSTQGQAEEGVSLEAQAAKLRAWAELQGAELVLFSDEGISGKRADNRPGLVAALAACGRGDALVVYSLSRLSRSTADTLRLAEALERKGSDLVSISEKIDTTSAAGRMVFRMLAVLAEFERDQIADRTRFALAHKRAKGEKTGGCVPFGFSATEEGKLLPHKGEQQSLALALELRESGKSLRGIAAELEARGIRRKCGGSRWSAEAVKQLVRTAARATAAA